MGINTSTRTNVTTASNTVPIHFRQMETEKKLKPRRLSIIREFCLNTSTHGLPGIARSQSLHNRIFWSISLLAFTGFMVYLIVTAVLAYFQYPTQINIDIVTEWPQLFPAFSFCNAGAMRLDQLMEPFMNYTNALNWTVTNGTTMSSTLRENYLPSFIQYKINRNESIESFFYPLSSMLHTCSYNSQPCSVADFISFTSSIYGSCYTFNAKLKNTGSDALLYGDKYGGNGQLRLGLYVHSHQYVPYIVDGTFISTRFFIRRWLLFHLGIAIVGLVHDNIDIPIVDVYGLNLIPGRKHKLAYRKKTNNFLPPPYTSCTNKIPLSIRTVLINYPNADYGYSQYLCFRANLQVYTLVFRERTELQPYLAPMHAIEIAHPSSRSSHPKE